MAKGIFIFDGNIGNAPELRYQPANERSHGEPRPLLKFNVKYDRLVKTNDPNNAYEDKGGFWVAVDYWDKDGDELSKLLLKGMRVRIEGELRMDVWEDKNNPGQMVSGMALTASSIAILPRRIESLILKPSQGLPSQHNMAPAQEPEL
ncbi:single-stranded DNA-binding protein [Vibrio sp. TBV020]|uniref:single-stranded DNA-binding protein n=1 Tax=Vibrio sp. TBV020 TaxID=3137398 RepID=UPI0038CD86B4